MLHVIHGPYCQQIFHNNLFHQTHKKLTLLNHLFTKCRRHMALEASIDHRNHAPPYTANGAATASPEVALPPSRVLATHRLRLNPSSNHNPDSYDDLALEFTPHLFSSLERYLPPNMLSMSRDSKLQYMRDILVRYSPDGERTRVKFSSHLCLFF